MFKRRIKSVEYLRVSPSWWKSYCKGEQTSDTWPSFCGLCCNTHHLWEMNYRKLQEALQGPWNTQAYLQKEQADCCTVNADIHWTLLQVFNSFSWCSSTPPSTPLFTRMPNSESLHPLTAQRHCIMYHCVQTMLSTFKSKDLSQRCMKRCSFLTSKFKVEGRSAK